MHIMLFIFLSFYWFLEREEGRKKENCSTHLHIDWLILVCALTGIQPLTLVGWDDMLTN